MYGRAVNFFKRYRLIKKKERPYLTATLKTSYGRPTLRAVLSSAPLVMRAMRGRRQHPVEDGIVSICDACGGPHRNTSTFKRGCGAEMMSTQLHLGRSFLSWLTNSLKRSRLCRRLTLTIETQAMRIWGLSWKTSSDTSPRCGSAGSLDLRH
jgi:hypothetical protein